MVETFPDSLWSLSSQQQKWSSVMQYCNNYTRQGGERLSGPRPSISTGLVIQYSTTSILLSMNLNINSKLKQERFSNYSFYSTVCLFSPPLFPCIHCTSSIHATLPLSLCRQAPLRLLDIGLAKHGMWHPVPVVEMGGGAQRVPTPLEVKPQFQQGNRGGCHRYNQLQIPQCCGEPVSTHTHTHSHGLSM